MDPSKPESLTKAHDLTAFDCGNQLLTVWLKNHALQSQTSGHTKTMVVTQPDNVVIGYYSYNVISVEHGFNTPDRVMKGLAKHPIPVFFIARLAIDVEHQRKGLGSRLLLHALKGSIRISEVVPIRAIVVDAIDNAAKNFYQEFDFAPWPPDGMRMWLMMKDLLKSIEAD
jgi:GNAT superfamily N-acetyltransferase